MASGREDPLIHGDCGHFPPDLIAIGARFGLKSINPLAGLYGAKKGLFLGPPAGAALPPAIDPR
jgi:hypothetical protein